MFKLSKMNCARMFKRPSRVKTFCGIYSPNFRYNDQRVDLRSDGSAVISIWTGNDWLPQSKPNWKLDGNTVTVGESEFKIEGSDLIDSRGNRWLHIR